MITVNPSDNITLYYRQKASDKVYQARIEPVDGQFIVSFAFGRRGSALQAGTKTAVPVSYAEAKQVYEKLVKQKMAKGYSPGPDGTPYQQTPREERSTGIVPQLLNPMGEEEALRLLADPEWWAQEKLDGKRMLIRRTDDAVTGINRSGLAIPLPAPIVDQARNMGSPPWVLDGECLGDRYIAFDLLESAGTDLRPHPYRRRMRVLGVMMAKERAGEPVRLIETANNAGSKRSLWNRLKQQGREGIVLKRHDAPYTPGRPASGGSQLKCKFTATASCLVAAVNSRRRSVSLSLLDGSIPVLVGSVTIPPNHPIPLKGEVVEVKYLYCTYPGGSLYQPVYLGQREDVIAGQCQLRQLKYRSGEEDP